VSGKLDADVIVVGGGPAGSTLAWELARSGARVLVLERAGLPREKVCGDFVDPRGLQVLAAMGALEGLERGEPVAISRTSMFVEWERRYDGPIPFYGGDEAPSHGSTIPRLQLDAAMLEAAVRAGAGVHEETAVSEIEAGAQGVEVLAARAGRRRRYKASLLVGADGVNSLVARRVGRRQADPLCTVVAQRAYASGYLGGEEGTNEIFFQERLFPGYGWIFPVGKGRVNVGVGLLAETRRRREVKMPALFSEFLDGLRARHPGCSELELCSSPIGGAVRTYGAAGSNHFDGGLLVGDAGSFANPMTGEGITPGMESALLAAPVLRRALEEGDYSEERLAGYGAAFRAYFDPSMTFLSLIAATMRDEHFARPWLKAFGRGCELAQGDPDFARTSGSFFGGIEVRPFGILGQVLARCGEDALLAWPRLLAGSSAKATTPGDLLAWQAALARSVLGDPAAHMRWAADVRHQWRRLLTVAKTWEGDPRAKGLLER
jgi:geranylgeranyl reductase family protein